MPGETNYIHEAEIWRQRLKTEVEQAAQWHDNWGFLAGREQGEPRGFSEKVAKYSYGHAQWSVSSVRVPDNTEEGIAAAMSEQNARKLMSTLKWDTLPATETKKCLMPSGPNKGMVLVPSDKSGVPTREAALLMRSHKFQSLGDACLTEGVDPGIKYTAPLFTSHEYGWRAPSTSNKRPNLELFGVAEHARRQVAHLDLLPPKIPLPKLEAA